jgi:hypothetical protein
MGKAAFLVVLAALLMSRRIAWLLSQRRCPGCRAWLRVDRCCRGWTELSGGSFREGRIWFYSCRCCRRSFCRAERGRHSLQECAAHSGPMAASFGS